MFQNRPGLLCFAIKKHQSKVDLFISDETAEDVFFWAELNEPAVRFAVQLRRIKSPMIEDHFAMRILDCDTFLSQNFKHVQSHFGMTKQEYHICKLLLCGRTVQDIVVLHGKSPDTVRFHIKNIYRRMGVSSREEMFAGLMHFLFD
ncbi:helix-turn-helix transcriptional regulator [Sphingomonas sp.]|jgi:DNA-binding CsgD family transcriptional regulator|uniref:helix-turn-helix transcriptional regulator n=1 Tax=Sphingomonas sp. TaxID=28214 RepID=UPI002E11C150|nr:helix-turn-helix transcriptional regulator [Sphingomonas sp.]